MTFLKRTVALAAVALGFACLSAQEITFDSSDASDARDITLYQMKPGEIEGSRQDTPTRDRRRGEDINVPQGVDQDRPRDGGTSPSQDKPQDGGRAAPPQGNQRDGSKGDLPQDRQRDGRGGAPQGGGKGAGRAAPGGQPRGGGTNPPPPSQPPRPHTYGGGSRWKTYLLLSVPLPIVSHDYDEEGSFSGAGGGMGFSLYKVHPDSNFAMMFRMGLALVGGEFSGSFEDNWDKDENASVGGVTSFYSYFRFGFGGAIEPDREGHFALIPTGGVGVSFTTLSADVTVEEVYPTGVYKDKREKSGLDFTFDVFVDLTAAFMFTDNFGLSASCEVAMNLLGLGGFADVSYTVFPPSFTVTPAVSICLRF